jgi:5-methylcytosine-specific restriction endonuclease McrA
MASALRDTGSTARWRKIRQRILERDAYTCQGCGLEGNTVDHIIARSLGGGDEENNLQCLCFRCNSAKGGINRQNAKSGKNGKNADRGGFFSGASTPLTLPGLISPKNDSKSHEND